MGYTINRPLSKQLNSSGISNQNNVKTLVNQCLCKEKTLAFYASVRTSTSVVCFLTSRHLQECDVFDNRLQVDGNGS